MPVTEGALIHRINRILAKENKAIHRCRFSSRWYRDLGRYYRVDLWNNQLEWGVDSADELEAYAREIRALAPYEYLAI